MNDLADELLGPLPTRKAVPVSGPIHFTILGEAVSKANSREAVFFGKGDSRRIAWIKSKKAREYERTASLQVPKLSTLITGPVFVEMTIWYASERPDLDESLVLDVMQKRIYVNDRQVREKWIKHGIDRANPRAEITVTPLTAQTIPLELE